MSPPTRGRIALLYDCTYPHVPGGGQKRLYEVFRRLVEKGWSVDWYGMKSWAGNQDPIVAGIHYIPVGPERPLYGPDGKRSIGQTLHYGRAIARIPALGRYDVIHLGQWPYFHFFPSRFFALLGGARVSADWWEVWGDHWLEYYGFKGLLGMALERVCARIPDRIVAISEIGQQQLRGLGVDPGRLAVIHNGIDLDAIRAAPPTTEKAEFVYLGRLQPHKNVNLLVEALAILKGRGRELRLSVVGDGPERDTLMTLAEARGIAGQIAWHGAIESDVEVYSLLRSARVFVHPSTKEGGGSITSLEANAAGLPVVAFAHPGGISSELIFAGRNGAWVQEVTAEALADGLARVLDDCDAATSDMARSFAQDFDWSEMAARYDDILIELVSGKSR